MGSAELEVIAARPRLLESKPPVDPPGRIPLVLFCAGLWLIWSAWASCAGWALSVIGVLNGWGYLLLLPVLMSAWWWWWRWCRPRLAQRCFLRRPRLHGLLHACFLCVAFLSLLGGALYIPWNFDAFTYRLLRVLYWWSANSWYWIGTVDPRLDFGSCGFEWQMLPVLIASKSDRLLFLLNWLPYLLMPGLTFLAFRSLGIGRATARIWMWFLPTGYCYALQAGGIQNDGYAANFVLACVAFGGWALRSKSTVPVLMAFTALSLLTGAKLSNLPLVLPLGVSLIPALVRARRQWAKLLPALPVLLLVSCIPLAVLSKIHCGSWVGDPLDVWKVKITDHIGGGLANLALMLNDWLHPPIMPLADKITPWLDVVEKHPEALWARMKAAHGTFSGLYVGDLAYEAGSGAGFGLFVFLCLILVARVGFRRRSAKPTRLRPSPVVRLMPWLTLIAFVAYLTNLGSEGIARIGAPYYPLLAAALLRSASVDQFHRTRLARIVAVLLAVLVFPVLVLSPARPLVPWRLLPANGGALQKVRDKYQFWSLLRDDLAPLRAQLPREVHDFGYACGFRDTSYGLWKPFGSRVFHEMGIQSSPTQFPAEGVGYAVLNARGIEARYDLDLNEWLEENHASIIFKMSRERALAEQDLGHPEEWYLVRFDVNYLEGTSARATQEDSAYPSQPGNGSNAALQTAPPRP